jgi:colanic acid biosynthesis glycosyl transferase WcaI
MSEERNGVRVHRHWLRVRPEENFVDKALYELTVSTMGLPHVARLIRKSDVVICVVPTLGSAVLSATLRRFRATRRLVLWVQDLVIEAATTVEGIRPATVRALGGFRRIESAAVRSADVTIVCSPGFRDYYRARNIPGARIEVVYNWVDVDWIETSPPPDTTPRRFLYTGNLGYTQGFETLAQAASLVGSSVEIVIVGNGNAASHVAALTRELPNVTVRSPVPSDEYPGLLASADVQLVLQRRVGAGANLPSKIGPYLASQRPILASIEEATPAAELLRASGGAVIVPAEDPGALAEAMRRLDDDADLRRSLGVAGRAFAVEHLDRRKMLERFESIVLG